MINFIIKPEQVTKAQHVQEIKERLGKDITMEKAQNCSEEALRRIVLSLERDLIIKNN